MNGNGKFHLSRDINENVAPVTFSTEKTCLRETKYEIRMLFLTVENTNCYEIDGKQRYGNDLVVVVFFFKYYV